MGPCNHSSNAAIQNNKLPPSCENDTTDCASMALPLEIWHKIFNYLGFQDLRLFTEYKVKFLKKPLEGNEDNNRLMIGEKFIFYKEEIVNVATTVYNVALCCKEFYTLTWRERNLLINAAQWAKFDKDFLFSEQISAVPVEKRRRAINSNVKENFTYGSSGQDGDSLAETAELTPIKNKQDNKIKFKINKIQKILRSQDSIISHSNLISTLHRDKDFTPRLTLDTFNTNVVNKKLIDQPSRLLVEPIKLESLKLKLNEFKPLISDNILEKIKITELLVDENQASTEQEQPSDSNDK